MTSNSFAERNRGARPSAAAGRRARDSRGPQRRPADLARGEPQRPGGAAARPASTKPVPQPISSSRSQACAESTPEHPDEQAVAGAEPEMAGFQWVQFGEQLRLETVIGPGECGGKQPGKPRPCSRRFRPAGGAAPVGAVEVRASQRRHRFNPGSPPRGPNDPMVDVDRPAEAKAQRRIQVDGGDIGGGNRAGDSGSPCSNRWWQTALQKYWRRPRPRCASPIACSTRLPSAARDETRQLALEQQAQHAALAVQLAQPVFVAAVGAGAVDVEIAVKAPVQERAVADRRHRLELDCVAERDVRMRETAAAGRRAPRLDQRVAVIKPGVVQEALVGERIDLHGVMPGPAPAPRPRLCGSASTIS